MSSRRITELGGPTVTPIELVPTWREKTVIRILLIIAKMLATDERLAKDIEALANHVSVSR